MKEKKFSQCISLNGEFYNLQAYKLFNLQDLLFYFCYKQNLLVLEYNGKICTAHNWSLTRLNANDSIETITIVGGG